MLHEKAKEEEEEEEEEGRLDGMTRKVRSTSKVFTEADSVST